MKYKEKFLFICSLYIFNSQILIPFCQLSLMQQYQITLTDNIMNPSCFVCDTPASRVCKHPECSQPAFHCSGPCHKGLGLAQQQHTHNNIYDYISFQDFQKKINSIKQAMDPKVLHKQFLQKMKKKIIIAKDHLQQQINDLDKVLDKVENDLRDQGLSLKLTKKSQEAMKNIESNPNMLEIKGKYVNTLYKTQLNFRDQKKIRAAIKQVKDGFESQLQKISQFKVSNMFITFKQRLQNSKVLFLQGMDLKMKNQTKQALQKLRQARKVNNFEYSIHFWVGFCLSELNQLDKAESSYRYSLELNPYDSDIYDNIGFIYQRRKNYKEAINWYTQAIQIYGKNASYYCGRGHCFVMLKKYQEGKGDYVKAMKMNPEVKMYEEKVQEIEDLMAENGILMTYSMLK